MLRARRANLGGSSRACRNRRGRVAIVALGSAAFAFLLWLVVGPSATAPVQTKLADLPSIASTQFQRTAMYVRPRFAPNRLPWPTESTYLDG